jgi:ParB family chromosome partitioning protein
MNRQNLEIPIADVQVKYRARQQEGDLTTLESSIRTIGLLHPIVVDRNHVLIAGGRRLAACRNLGLTTIPAIKLDTEFAALAALDVQSDENLCRMPLTSEELARHIEVKKAAIPDRTPGTGAGFLGWLKRLFAGN